MSPNHRVRVASEGYLGPRSRTRFSLSFLVLLKTPSSIERAVFLLREVFDYGYDEVAEIVD